MLFVICNFIAQSGRSKKIRIIVHRTYGVGPSVGSRAEDDGVSLLAFLFYLGFSFVSVAFQWFQVLGTRVLHHGSRLGEQRRVAMTR